MTGAFDSRPDTEDHIARVQELMLGVIGNLGLRTEVHDRSKLDPPEKEMFDRFTPRLRESTYGSAEYEEARAEMGEALQHHYAENSHHPEHFAAGIAGMSLLDVTEMLADWKAATERHDDGDLRRSICEVNRERFGYGEELERLLLNTATEMGWL